MAFRFLNYGAPSTFSLPSPGPGPLWSVDARLWGLAPPSRCPRRADGGLNPRGSHSAAGSRGEYPGGIAFRTICRAADAPGRAVADA